MGSGDRRQWEQEAAGVVGSRNGRQQEWEALELEAAGEGVSDSRSGRQQGREAAG